MPSVFTRIIDGELPGRFVWRDDDVVAFLSIEPMRPGHTLVVPREEVDHWVDMDPELAGRLFGTAHVLGQAINRAFEPRRVGVMVVGDDNKVSMRTLTVRQPYQDFYIVSAGVKPGERVIVEGLQKVRPGLEVKAELKPASDAKPAAGSAPPPAQPASAPSPAAPAAKPKSGS